MGARFTSGEGVVVPPMFRRSSERRAGCAFENIVCHASCLLPRSGRERFRRLQHFGVAALVCLDKYVYSDHKMVFRRLFCIEGRADVRQIAGKIRRSSFCVSNRGQTPIFLNFTADLFQYASYISSLCPRKFSSYVRNTPVSLGCYCSS